VAKRALDGTCRGRGRQVDPKTPGGVQELMSEVEEREGLRGVRQKVLLKRG